MIFSIVSLVNALCFSSLSILLFICIARQSVSLALKRFLMLLVILAVMIHLLVPAEFASQNNIYVTRFYPDLYLPFIKTSVPIAGKGIPLPLLAAAISLIGSLIYFGRLLFSYIRISSTLRKCRPANDGNIPAITAAICSELGYRNHFRIVIYPDHITPFLFGLIKPTIVLPNEVLSDETLYFILKHEINHAHHKDLWLRFGCELLLGIYWWNPFLYLLRNQSIVMQEWYADSSVVGKSDELQQINYTHCLVKMAKLALPAQANKSIATFNDGTGLRGRIENLAHSSGKSAFKKHSTWIAYILSAMLLVCISAPCFFILEPRKEIPKEILENTVRINSDNSYLLLTGEGKYAIYIENKYFATVTQIFDDTLPIYNTQGERIK